MICSKKSGYIYFQTGENRRWWDSSASRKETQGTPKEVVAGAQIGALGHRGRASCHRGLRGSKWGLGGRGCRLTRTEEARQGVGGKGMEVLGECRRAAECGCGCGCGAEGKVRLMRSASRKNGGRLNERSSVPWSAAALLGSSTPERVPAARCRQAPEAMSTRKCT